MARRKLAAIGWVGALLLVITPAGADVAPPPDYVEQCTRAKQEADSEYCELASASYEDPYGCLAGTLDDTGNGPADPEACKSGVAATDADCCQEWIDDGWSYRCKTYGGSFYSALWCRARQPGDPARPVDEIPESGDDGCSIASAPPAGVPPWTPLLWLLLASAFGLRRRRR